MLRARLDYLRVSFKTKDIDQILDSVLGIDKEYMADVVSGRYGYEGYYELDHIHCHYPKEDDITKGAMIEMSGQGCRQFEAILEAQNRTWFDFLETCLLFVANFPRIDLAIDDFKTYLNISKLIDKAEKGEVITWFRNYDSRSGGDLQNRSSTGKTIYFGSKKSDVYFCFYEKNHEQAKKQKIAVEEIGPWNRYEIRVHDDRAKETIKKLIERQNFSYIAMGILKYQLTFINPNESNKYRSEIYEPWHDFLKDVERIKITTDPKGNFYEKTKEWLFHSAASSVRMVYEADKLLGTKDLSNIIQTEMKPRQEKMLKVYAAETKDFITLINEV